MITKARWIVCGWGAIAAIALGGPAPAHAEVHPWLGTDKAAHAVGSALFASTGYAFAARHLDRPWQRALVGGGIAMTFGLAKELADELDGRGASGPDLVWDAVGMAVGVGVSLLIDLLLDADP